MLFLKASPNSPAKHLTRITNWIFENAADEKGFPVNNAEVLVDQTSFDPLTFWNQHVMKGSVESYRRKTRMNPITGDTLVSEPRANSHAETWEGNMPPPRA
jgi:hypothetical protein